MQKKFKIGIVGCGNISGAYLRAAQTFKESIELTICSDINMKAAEAKAAEFGLKATSPEDLYSDKNIDIVLNLTLPAVHAEVNRLALNSGKHVTAKNLSPSI